LTWGEAPLSVLVLAVEEDGANARDGPALNAGLEVEGEKAVTREEVLAANVAEEVDLGQVRRDEVEAGGRGGTGVVVVNFLTADLKKREAALPSRGLAAKRKGQLSARFTTWGAATAHVRPPYCFSYFL
jgi:hypothetical protein